MINVILDLNTIFDPFLKTSAAVYAVRPSEYRPINLLQRIILSNVRLHNTVQQTKTTKTKHKFVINS